MKKSILLSIAGCGAILLPANYAKAQETVVVEEATITEVPVECKTTYTSSWRDNWFIQLGAGMQLPYVDKNPTGKDKHHITAVYNVGFGHWFSPYLGFRLSGYYGKMHYDWDGFKKAKMGTLNADLMWDMCNSIAGPNPNRVLSIVPFVGVGGTYTWDFNHVSSYSISDGDGHVKTREWTLPVSTGIQLRLRLCKYVDFFAEGRVQWYADNFNNVDYGDPIEANLTVIGGLTFNLGGRKYQGMNPCDYLDYINGLNNQVNDLRGELAATAAALAAAEAQLPCPEVVEAQQIIVEAPLFSTVRFKINSAKISNEEMVNVYNVAQWMNANPQANVVIQGYADKDTGTSTYNMKLSERRAQAVIDALTNKYGIDPSRLTTQAYGSDVQPYDVNNWNRIVLFTQP